MTDCPACRRIALSRAGTNPFFIAELSESLAVLHDHQPYDGWCVLVLKDHAEHLHALPIERQQRLAADVGRVAAAIVKAFSPKRINYECLGNQLAHVHWHVIPRYDAPKDPDPRNVVWVRPAHELQCAVDPKKRDEMILRLQTAGLR